MSNQYNLQQVSATKCYEGTVRQYKHVSPVLQCEMHFHVFLPSSAEATVFPVIYFLSGLTCNDTNFITKACAIEHAARLKVALLCPDTSPRGDNIPTGDKGEWDFGLGAGFYLNATVEPYSTHYRMFDYVVKELPDLLAQNAETLCLDPKRQSVMGHSMGGHGALIAHLRNPLLFKSCSAFAPICHPSDAKCAWGQKAFSRYLGNDVAAWNFYDACHALKEYKNPSASAPILVDQGSDDKFLAQGQLQPEALAAACKEAGQPLELRMQQGYDHSYYFIATFVKDHLEMHAKALHAEQ